MTLSISFKRFGLLVLATVIVVAIWLSLDHAASAQSGTWVGAVGNVTATIERLDGPKQKASITPISTPSRTPTRTKTPIPTWDPGGD